jgi:hypothetical protein
MGFQKTNRERMVMLRETRLTLLLKVLSKWRV